MSSHFETPLGATYGEVRLENENSKEFDGNVHPIYMWEGGII